MQLTDFEVLTFDCYGTLIDWETGIMTALEPLLARLDRPIPREDVMAAFARHETDQERETPTMRYCELLAAVHARLAREWGLSPAPEEDSRFGASVPHWPAFADSAPALHYLKRYYKLVVLSNVDKESFRGSNARLDVTFDAVYTAEEIGSYKPDPRNFAYLIERLAEQGIARAKILHTAQSLFHDHVPANAAGLKSAWIDRRHGSPGSGATMPADAHVDFRFPSLGAMAEAHRQTLGAGENRAI